MLRAMLVLPVLSGLLQFLVDIFRGWPGLLTGRSTFGFGDSSVFAIVTSSLSGGNGCFTSLRNASA